MIRFVLTFTTVLFLAVSYPGPSAAQSGVGVSYGFNVDFHDTMIGFHGRLDLQDLDFRQPVMLWSSFEIFPDTGASSLVQLDVNAYYQLPAIARGSILRTGAGIGITRGENFFRDRIHDRSSEAFNILGTAELDFWESFAPFAAIRVSLIGGNDHTSVMFGGLYTFGQ